MIAVDLDTPAFVPRLEDAQMIEHLVWPASSRLVTDVWVAGTQVVEHGVCPRRGRRGRPAGGDEEELRQTLGLGQTGGAVDTIGKDGIPGVPHTTEVLTGAIGGAGSSHHLLPAGGDGRTGGELQLGVDLGDRLGEAALVADQPD
jgi:hypothetical protein